MTKVRRRKATTSATTMTPTSSMIQRFDFPSAAASAAAGAGLSTAGTAPPWSSSPSIALSSITRRVGGAGSLSPPNRDVTAMSQNRAVPEAVIFDFYGTLAHWADSTANYTTVFSTFGYEPAP